MLLILILNVAAFWRASKSCGLYLPFQTVTGYRPFGKPRSANVFSPFMDMFMDRLSNLNVVVNGQMQDVCHACYLLAGGHCERNVAGTACLPPAMTPGRAHSEKSAVPTSG